MSATPTGLRYRRLLLKLSGEALVGKAGYGIDVDVVMRLESIFSYDISSLPADQQQAFQQGTSNSTYTRHQFRTDVLAVLNARFGEDVQPGTKAVAIKARGNRRKADVLIAIQHRLYTRYGSDGGDWITGISFLKSDGTQVVNYPRQHRENLTTKNQATGEWFKHLVRICKNARERMISDGIIKAGVAPSYYIEGLLYNVPREKFGSSYSDSMVACINWLVETDRTDFVCANERYYLLRNDPDVTWNAKDCTTYLDGLVKLWNEW